MINRLVLMSMLTSIVVLSPVAADPRRGEQNEARQDMRAGKVKPLREIEAKYCAAYARNAVSGTRI